MACWILLPSLHCSQIFTAPDDMLDAVADLDVGYIWSVCETHRIFQHLLLDFKEHYRRDYLLDYVKMFYVCKMCMFCTVLNLC